MLKNFRLIAAIIIFLAAYSNVYASDLIDAVKSNNLDNLKKAIEAGANVNETDGKNWTALMEAAGKGKAEMIQYLISKGAEVDAKDKNGWTALLEAAEGGNLETTKALIESGANINEKVSSNGMTPLLYAVRNGKTKVAKLLIEKGANKNETNNKGETALSIAQKKGNKKIIEILDSAPGSQETGSDGQAITNDDILMYKAITEGHLTLFKLARIYYEGINVTADPFKAYVFNETFLKTEEAKEESACYKESESLKEKLKAEMSNEEVKEAENMSQVITQKRAERSKN